MPSPTARPSRRARREATEHRLHADEDAATHARQRHEHATAARDWYAGRRRYANLPNRALGGIQP